MSDQNSTATQIPEIPDYIAENYDQLVADENRGLSYDEVATRAAESGDVQLAAWARRRAKEGGDDVTPHGAKAAGGDEQRGQDYNDLKLDDLKALVEARKLDDDGLKLKADYVAALELADSAQ
jgi:hypothetical protein